MAANIQIFGKPKCFDTKKAQRFFKERNVKFQYIDLSQRAMSAGELKSVIASIGSIDSVIDEKSKNYCDIKYLLDDGKFDKLIDQPLLLKTPIVRCSKRASVGVNTQIWEEFLKL